MIYDDMPHNFFKCLFLKQSKIAISNASDFIQSCFSKFDSKYNQFDYIMKYDFNCKLYKFTE